MGLDTVEVSVPQPRVVGAEAEVDFAEFYAVITGVMTKLWMFVARLSYRGGRSTSRSAPRPRKLFWRGMRWRSLISGPCPARVRCDNLTPAAVRVLKGRDRVEN